MLKKVTAVLFMMVLVFSVSLPVFAQDSMAKEAKDTKDTRVEGRVVRMNKDKMTITVRSGSNDVERQVMYDAPSKFTSQYNANKTVNTIDADQIKEGDQVICLGSYDDKKVFHATTISKRLSHPN